MVRRRPVRVGSCRFSCCEVAVAAVREAGDLESGSGGDSRDPLGYVEARDVAAVAAVASDRGARDHRTDLEQVLAGLDEQVVAVSCARPLRSPRSISKLRNQATARVSGSSIDSCGRRRRRPLRGCGRGLHRRARRAGRDRACAAVAKRGGRLSRGRPEPCAAAVDEEVAVGDRPRQRRARRIGVAAALCDHPRPPRRRPHHDVLVELLVRRALVVSSDHRPGDRDTTYATLHGGQVEKRALNLPDRTTARDSGNASTPASS